MRATVRFAAAAAALAMVSAPANVRAMPHAALEPPSRQLRWLNLGDSFGAGEGATRTVGHCQQSPNASGPKAATILREERRWGIAPDVFSACTGDWAADIFNSRDELQSAQVDLYERLKPPGLRPRASEIRNNQSLDEWAMDQGAMANTFDVVVASFSGNDIGFADVVRGCIDIVRNLGEGANAVTPLATGSPWEAFARATVVPKALDRLDPVGCGPVAGELRARIDRLFKGTPYPSAVDSPLKGARGSLFDIYRALADKYLADGGTFIVMGYPRLMTPSSDWGRWRGGQCNMMTGEDADAIGKTAEYYDQEMAALVSRLGPRFQYVSRLKVFDDSGTFHSLCGRTVEWLNTPLVWLRDGSARYQRAFHPNDLGYLATAETVAGSVEGRLGVNRPSASSTTATGPAPTVRSSDPHFNIGDSFSAQCVVAWPTAPSRGANGIQMRTSCGGVPSQFLFVDIVYGDPDLPVTPSRSRMQVTGRIADISRSEYGFTVLVVRASKITVL